MGIAPTTLSRGLQPALDQNFLVGEELDAVQPLTVQVAEEQLFLPAEGERRRRRRHADVDADIAGADAVLEFAGDLPLLVNRLAALP